MTLLPSVTHHKGMPAHPPVLTETSQPLSPVPEPPAMTQRLLVILGVCAFASAASMRVLDPVMPLIASEFGKTIQEAALLTTWFTISYAIGQPILGPMGDSFGKARLISISLLAVAVFLVMAEPRVIVWIIWRNTGAHRLSGWRRHSTRHCNDRRPRTSEPAANSSGAIYAGNIVGTNCGRPDCGRIIALCRLARRAADRGRNCTGCRYWIMDCDQPRPIANRPPLSPALAMQNYATILRNRVHCRFICWLLLKVL